MGVIIAPVLGSGSAPACINFVASFIVELYLESKGDEIISNKKVYPI